MCGEHQNASRLSHGPLGSSPHVRGALRPSATIGLGCGIIPACAGSTLFCHRFFGRFRDHPRMCGEHLPESAICGHSRGSSPHVRGAQNLLPIMQDLDGIIPACAGSTCARLSARLEHGDHPRMCGEHGRLATMPCRSPGSSPHVRGAQRLERQSCSLSGIIPACAGSTSWETLRRSSIRDHPRMCGEHELGDFAAFLDQGSSPHVRGALRQTQRQGQRLGIIPACAGSTPTATRPSREPRDHPRMCGEHFTTTGSPYCSSGSSPHVRGAPTGDLLGVTIGGIIPACAGSTPTATRPSREPRDHPRMCGEHLPDVSLAVPLPGSSPHVRGARPCLPLVAEPCGIIPACAGSTVGR